MARRPRHDVEKGERLVVLVDLVGRQFAAQDFGKDVVRVVARSSSLSAARMSENALAESAAKVIA